MLILAVFTVPELGVENARPPLVREAWDPATLDEVAVLAAWLVVEAPVPAELILVEVADSEDAVTDILEVPKVPRNGKTPRPEVDAMLVEPVDAT